MWHILFNFIVLALSKRFMQPKTKKWIAWGCGSIIALFLLFVLFIVCVMASLTRDNRIATDPEAIADEADFDLPAYVVISQDDNMDRGASAWSSYVWELKLKSPLAEDELQELNELVAETPHWRYDSENNIYYFSLEESERNISIIIDADEARVTLDYYWWDMLS